MIDEANEEVDGIIGNYNMGLITKTNVTIKLLIFGQLPMQN